MGLWREIMARHKGSATGQVDPASPMNLRPDRPYGSNGNIRDAAQEQPADRRAPMGSADLVYGPDGRVAWGEIWEDFCDLGLTDGPPHRGDLLASEGLSAAAIADPDSAARVREELTRGLSQTTSWPVVEDVEPGWLGLRCPDAAAAAWMARAILAENVDARAEGDLLLVPAGPAFTLTGEIKNVVTSVAKTWHYWARHGMR
jgi:sirohydrochlorin cobaltochelatase